MKTRLGLLIVTVTLVIASCNVINPDEETPSFIHIDELILETDFLEEGSNSHKISEVWAFDNGVLLGAYDLPADIPVLSEGETNLSFRAGIKNNGIAATRIMYPFFKTYEVTENMKPLESVNVTPTFEYQESTFFRLREEFEDAGNKFVATDNSDTILFNVAGEEAFEGNSSGKVVLHGATDHFEVETDDELSLPAGKLIWVEMNYKSNNSFAIGLKAYQGANVAKNLALIVNPTTDDQGEAQWNKIYVELTLVANQHLGAEYFKLYIESNLDATLAEADADAEIYFDNFKIIHFE